MKRSTGVTAGAAAFTIIKPELVRGAGNEKLKAGLVGCGGRGIYIIRSLMDEVRFEAGGSELHMRKNLVRACQEKLHSAASPTA